MQDNDDIDLARDLLMEDEAAMLRSSVARWLPMLVVVSALAGFVGLAWYAYRTGAQSMKEEDLMVVEADKTPVKEKPADPGGMKFPNQDKTIFETFSGNAPPPKVERVLPAPEEPMPREADASGTKTWVNDKLKDVPAEQVVAEKKAEAPPTAKPAEPAPAEPAKPAAQSDDTIVSYAKPTAKAEKPVEKVAVPAEKPVEPKYETAPASGKSAAKIQLGAYRSEAEAREAWVRLQNKYPELSDKSPIIVKADLGEKGIYYRLRVGLSSADSAKVLCTALSSRGQSCLAVKE